MGAINYYTSDFVTIGYNLNFVDYEDDFYNDIISDYYYQVKYRLNREKFSIFTVELKPGYYEGFTIDLKLDYFYFEDYIEKREAQKEITRIKNFLIECINDFECCAVFPGWCTTYLNYDESIKAVSEAVQEMREAVRSTPTYKNYTFSA